MNNIRYIFTVTTGRSGQETLANLLNHCVDDVHASFEAPVINTIFKGRLANFEHKIRRRCFETHDLLGRGKVLKAYSDNNVSFINAIASKRIKTANNELSDKGKYIYVDVSKYFARGLYVGFCNILPQTSIINLVRDPLMNIKSFVNRKKNFLLDNNLPDDSSNILQLDSSNMQKEELYLWAWCEMYLRFQHMKNKKCVKNHVEILTEKLNDHDYLAKSLKLIDLRYRPGCQVKTACYNTNLNSGHPSTFITLKDIDIFYKFIEKVPLDLRKKIVYLDNYNPEVHML
jgi:hypothetical protein